MFLSPDSLTPFMINLNQLFLKDLGLNCQENKLPRPEVKCAVFHTMVYDENMIEPLIRC